MATKRNPDVPKKDALTNAAKSALKAALDSARGSKFKTTSNDGFSASLGGMPIVKAKPRSYSGKKDK